MSVAALIFTAGILFLLTPAMMAWSKFGQVSEESLLRLMMTLNVNQMLLLRAIHQSGIVFIFIGCALLLAGF